MLSCHIFSNYFMIKPKMLNNKQKTKTLQEALMAESLYLCALFIMDTSVSAKWYGLGSGLGSS